MLVPTKFAPYAKAWVSLIGAIATLIVTAAPALPWWVGIIPAALTAVGTYLVPNTPAAPAIEGDDHTDTEDEEPTTVIESAAGPIVPLTAPKKATRKPRAPATKKAAAKKSTTAKEN